MSSFTPTLRRRFVVGAAVSLAVVLGAAAPALTASAAPTAAEATGWVRLAHLSPNTKAVDVRITDSNGSTILRLGGVGYGDISPYQQLSAGVYGVTMVSKGSPDTADPILRASMKIVAGKAQTVAAFGDFSQLKVKAFTDDLTAPTGATARVRLIQASTKVLSVNVNAGGTQPIASDARAGSATGYAAVPAGSWTLQLAGKSSSGKKVSASSSVTLAAGSVNSLLVLDDPTGLQLRPVLDSAAVAAAPIGGVNTGGGWLASHPQLLHAAP